MDANVILVDYSSTAEDKFYPQPASDIRVVAAQAARYDSKKNMLGKLSAATVTVDLTAWAARQVN